PGHDLALAAGFLLTEGVIEGRDDLRAIGPCRDPNDPNRHNVVLATLAAGSELAQSRVARAQRAFFTSSGCGLCGKTSIDALVQAHATFDAPLTLPASLLAQAGARARADQRLFDA